MKRILLRVFALLLVLASPLAAQAFAPAGLRDEATAYVGALRKAAPPDPKGEERKLAVRKAEQDADAAAKSGDGRRAVELYERAVGLGGGADFGLLMKLSRAWSAPPSPSPQRAAQAAYAAYQAAKTHTANAGAALWRLADLFDAPATGGAADGSLNEPRQARAALTAIVQRVADDPKGRDALYPAQRDRLDARLLELRRRLGSAVTAVEAEAQQERPRICVRFDESLHVGAGVRFEDFVAVAPAPAELIADAEGASLCLRGVAHGGVYRVTLREGLPGRDGVVLKTTAESTVIVPDRPASLSFRAGGRVLAKTAAAAIPFAAVNVDEVNVRVYRLNDRALVPFLNFEGMNDETGDWQAERLGERDGELVWKGVLTVEGEPNRETVVGVPFAEIVPRPQPGYYAVTLDPKGVESEAKPWGVATQWVLVTDIGLTAHHGADGLHLFARSLSTAKPSAGTVVTLVARNNAELGRAVTDADGRAVFAAGLMQAAGGAAPYLAMAYGADDYAVLNLTQAAFDLSDRGVGGRMQPGPLDAYVYADRGVYRQGETVNLTALTRDDRTAAAAKLPLTVKILRPSGTEYLSQTLTTDAAGAVTLPVVLSPTAPLGGWTVRVYADPNRPPVGTGRFTVEDFIPERLEVALSPSAAYIGSDAGGGTAPFTVTVNGRFLYGAPAVGLGGTAELRIETDPAPYAGFADYGFGLAGEQVAAQAQALEMAPADDNGVTTITAAADLLPDVSAPLRARFDVALTEPGGRPATATLTVPVRRHAFALGLRPPTGGRLKEGEPARLSLVALDRDGKPAAVAGAAWTLIRERADFQWFEENGRYRYRAVRHDEPVGSGRIDVPAAAAGVTVTAGTPPVGRYRLEVAADGGLPVSRRFTVGWEPPDEPGDTPDTLEVTADQPAYRHGDTARVRITPPFAGEMLLTVATDRVHLVRTLSVAATGVTVDIPVDAAAWGPGAYVTAAVYRPPPAGKERQPVRALGLTWLGVDPAARRLDVALSAPAVARPRGPVEVTVKVTDAAGAPPEEETFITLAAVDEGILRLTRFASPDPGRHFFGKRALGVDIRDDYGRLIGPFLGMTAKMRAGGDASSAGLPALPFGLVSMFQGPIRLAADGTAVVRFDVPDFNGELRLMAVAFGPTRLGSAAQPLTVRDPLTADAYFPRFLAPGDRSRMTVSLHNVEAAPGRYAVAVTASGGVEVPAGRFALDLALETGRRDGFVVPLTAGPQEGVAHVEMTVTGPAGFSVTRGYDLTLRSPRPTERTFSVARLEPQQQLLIGSDAFAGVRPEGAALTAAFGASPPFDVAGILDALHRYPYGCVEQTVSAALPLLVIERLEKALGLPPDQAAAARVQAAISRLADRQRFDGAFGMWGAGEEAHDWLTAYVGEFLVRARQAGRFVPDAAMNNLLSRLERLAVDGGGDETALAARAYALHVLTLAGTATAGPLRYFHDAYIDRLPTALAKGQTAAALARFGDKTRAEHAFSLAVAHLSRATTRADDYGSALRDAAALLRLGTETGLAAPHLDALTARLPLAETAAARTSTQEQAWLVLAAESLTATAAAPPRLTATGAKLSGRDPQTLTVGPAQVATAGGVKVTNVGEAALWRTLSLSGIPATPLIAVADGLTLTRRLHRRDGAPVEPAALAQNDVFVVVLEGRATTGLAHQLMLTQPLPAGWEIEKSLSGPDSTIGDEFTDWLGTLSYVRTAEARDDRFNAAVDIVPAAPLGDGPLDAAVMFRVAFLARAVTPGDYELPGASVEDMYQPRFRARTAWGRVDVGAAQ